MRLRDLFCCEGGAGMGYHLAGFDEVVGVDVEDRSKRYPFDFVQADALEYVAVHGQEFDAIHASPPCQHYSITKHSHNAPTVDLLGPTRDVLTHPEVLRPGTPWIIENVPGAPMRNPITLCGASFGLVATDTDGMPLVLKRHRLFESNIWLTPQECECALYRDRGYLVGGVYGAGSSDRNNAREIRRGGYTPAKSVRAALIGADWMTLHGLSQSIPPAYTEYLGRQLLDVLEFAPVGTG